jgi:hypothetical protein
VTTVFTYAAPHVRHSRGDSRRRQRRAVVQAPDNTEVDYGDVIPKMLAFGWLVCLALGWGPSRPTIAVCWHAAVWTGGLAYFWWSAIWHLRERR